MFACVNDILMNVWKVVRELKKLNPLSTFTSTHKLSYIASILFTCVKFRINALTHVKIRWRWKPTLSCSSPTGHCLIFDSRTVLSPKSRTFSLNDIYPYLSCGEWRSKGTGKSVYVSNFFSSSKSLVDESRLIFMAQHANIFIIGSLCSIYKAVQVMSIKAWPLY